MKILFAVKIGNEDWQEELITAEIDLNEKPDFRKTVNI